MTSINQLTNIPKIEGDLSDLENILLDTSKCCCCYGEIEIKQRDIFKCNICNNYMHNECLFLNKCISCDEYIDDYFYCDKCYTNKVTSRCDDC